MESHSLKHPYFTEIPKEWGTRVPVKVTLQHTVRFTAPSGALIKAHKGTDLRTVVHANGKVEVISRKGHLIPVELDSILVLDWLEIS